MNFCPYMNRVELIWMRKKNVLSSSDFIAVPAYGRSSPAACLFTTDIAKPLLPPVHQVVKHLAREQLHVLSETKLVLDKPFLGDERIHMRCIC